MAMDIISKDKKEIQWRGLPQTSLSDIEELKVLILSYIPITFCSIYVFVCMCGGSLGEQGFLLYAFAQGRQYISICMNLMTFNSMNVNTQAERLGLGNRIGKKAAYLQELEEQVRNISSFIILISFSFKSIWNFYLQFLCRWGIFYPGGICQFLFPNFWTLSSS